MQRNEPGSFGKWLTARLIFYPTLMWNMLLGRWLKRRNWWDAIDDNVILGALPMPQDVVKLAALGVRGVVNTCEEYPGPVANYELHNIEQFRMPTIDFTHPAYQDIQQAIEFIDRQIELGHKVYIHCKAGRGRSATVAICWLMQSKQISATDAQEWLLEKRPHVNNRLPQRPVVGQFEDSQKTTENPTANPE